jgi:acyl-CoA synthetase (AMP-forming)/AMP-acid ligase II
LLSLVHVLEWRAAVTPGVIALSDQQGAELTYAGLAAAVERSAAGFAAAGIGPGDVVPVIARNQAGWVSAMLGLIRAGALPAAVNWRLAAPEVTALLRLAGPAAVLTDADCAALTRQAVAGLDVPVRVLDLAGPQPIADGARPAAEGAQPAADGARHTPPERPVDRLRPAEPAILVHTSGTTGRPKLVPLTHQQLITAVVFMKLEVPEAVPDARHLSALPLFHVAGLANLGYTLFTGGHLHLLAGFDPAGFVDELVRRRIQLTQLVPTLIHAVTQEVSARAEVAVIGVPDDRWGETVHAVVVLAHGADGAAGIDGAAGFDTATLVSWARERLAGFKCPTGVTVVPGLPRNATGKVLRAALRQPFWTGRDRLVS